MALGLRDFGRSRVPRRFRRVMSTPRITLCSVRNPGRPRSRNGFGVEGRGTAWVSR